MPSAHGRNQSLITPGLRRANFTFYRACSSRVTEQRYVISRYGNDFLKKRGLHLLLLCASDTGMDAAVIQPALIAILPSDK
jgi:hypothetical protein